MDAAGGSSRPPVCVTRRWGRCRPLVPMTSGLWATRPMGANCSSTGTVHAGTSCPHRANGNRACLRSRLVRPDDAWAVGVRGNGVVHTLIEHWDGRRWSVVRSPSPPGAHGTGPFAGLRAVTAISANDAWAAGESGGSARAPATRTLIEHWNGRRWTIVPSPNVRSARGVINDMLSGISASRPDDAWAVGLWGSRPRVSGSTGDHSLVLHWNGRGWSRVQTPAVARRSSLQAVATTGERAWAVGDRGFPRGR